MAEEGLPPRPPAISFAAHWLAVQVALPRGTGRVTMNEFLTHPLSGAWALLPARSLWHQTQSSLG